MADKFTWKAEITFHGTAVEFAKLAKVLVDLIDVEVKLPPWWPGPFPGYPPWPWWERIPKATLNKLIEGGEKLQIKWIKDFPGGIRDPHMHLSDEHVVLLDRKRFKLMVSEIASQLAAERVDRADDFVTVMGPIKGLDFAHPIEIP
jgi:hypothetical protein